ncbi:MAG: hypothetical protein KKA07_14695 [Bacteroidetes bacterium]|nr:hypothetical protein [Bacteroidota bacterium]MBU1720309.1 hypothetical protein [Bacteroidota bacterium]
MRKIAALFVLSVVLCACSSSSQQESTDYEDQTNSTVAEATQTPVTVYYFHGERRCASCVAIGDETSKMISTDYKTQTDKGLISFQEINIDEDKNKAIAEKYEIAGSALLVVKSENGKDLDQRDLTGDGFKFALNKPEKFREKLKEAIDAYLQ